LTHFWIRPLRSFVHGGSSTRPLPSIGLNRAAGARDSLLGLVIGREPIPNNACSPPEASRSDGPRMCESLLFRPDVNTAANPMRCESGSSGSYLALMLSFLPERQNRAGIVGVIKRAFSIKTPSQLGGSHPG